MISGFLFDWPDKCKICKTQICKSGRIMLISSCSFGFDYLKISEDLILAGFLVKEHTPQNKSRSKNLSRFKNNIISRDHYDSIIEKTRLSIISFNDLIESEKNLAVEKYLASGEYKNDFFERMKLEIKKGLSFVHDYKQINAQIVQNINVIIETRYDGDTFDDKLSKSTHAEKAIYFGSKFLQEKLNVAKYLLHPEWINRESEKTFFRFHGCLTKYIRLYKYMFEAKNISIKTLGESYDNIYTDPEIIGVIPHTFLDNALKYSKPNSSITINVNNNREGIYFAISSFGPLIKDGEKKDIFLPFIRGKEAEKMQEEGSGYGLFIAQEIAKSMGTEIKVQQETTCESYGYLTTFSVVLPYGLE
ncbi:sensor histidine kinase KdpD [Geobacter sp. FeAm09]|uniref:sensor histidine kinase n=1 Tax=Geobacter sp. FeAm09 TaxID=2597769 RepID=UPI00143D1892|nr:HAMP domain-containing sensor histidine kinase [Geobacter sp. FeAm09]